MAGGCALLGVVLYFFPLFRIVPLDAAMEARESQDFDPQAYGERFWTEELPSVAGQAVDVAELVAELARDPAAAKARYGRTIGLGDSHYFHVRGSGEVESVAEGEAIGLNVDGGDAVQVVIPTGLIFSNAVRDATGLIDVSSFASSRDFNDISGELNKRVEAEILPRLREGAAPGVRISFVGCAEVSGAHGPLPLQVIPVAVDFEPRE